MFQVSVVFAVLALMGPVSGLDNVQPTIGSASAEALPAAEFPLDTQIVWADPPYGFIDARQDTDQEGLPDGFTVIYVRFDQDVTLTLDNVEVFGNSEFLPAIDDVAGSGTDWVVVLDSPIPTGETTGIAFAAGVDALIYTAHPGDINGDYVTDEHDVTDLAAAVELGDYDVTQYDFDRNGTVDMQDVDNLDEALATTDIGGEWPAESGTRDGGEFTCCCNVLGSCYIAS